MTQEKNLLLRTQRTAYHWGILKGPNTEKPNEGSITEKPKDDLITVKPKNKPVNEDPEKLQEP